MVTGSWPSVTCTRVDVAELRERRQQLGAGQHQRRERRRNVRVAEERVRQRLRAAGDRRPEPLYHAGIVEWTRRPSHGWGGRASYTYSVLKDNQIGETNFYSAVGGIPHQQLQLQPVGAGCAAGEQFTTACYDPGRNGATASSTCRTASSSRRSSSCLRKGRGSPATAAWLMPFRRLGDRLDHHVAGGLPVECDQSNPNSVLGGDAGARPNRSGVDLATPGSYEDRLASADHPAATWINPAAFSTSGVRSVRQRAEDDHPICARRRSSTPTSTSRRACVWEAKQGCTAQARGAESVQPPDRSRPLPEAGRRAG